MSDSVHDWTDEQITNLEKKIAEVYRQASKDVKKDAEKFFESFREKDAKKKADLESGEITEAEYKSWRREQILKSKRYKSLQKKLAERMTRANEIALAYVNNDMVAIYAMNRNFSSYEIEKLFGNLDFTLFDENVVKRLIVDDPDLLPSFPANLEVDRQIDIDFNRKQITQTITSGILRGQSIGDIASELMDRLPEINRNSAVRAARTAITNAENAGRQDGYKAAAEMGITVRKRWVATLDSRTRDSHRRLDGETIDWDKKFSNGLMYPGDRSGKPEELYNCRCTMRTVEKEGIEAEERQRISQGGRIIKYMTFEEWQESKSGS